MPCSKTRAQAQAQTRRRRQLKQHPARLRNPQPALLALYPPNTMTNYAIDIVFNALRRKRTWLLIGILIGLLL